jgi:biotin carboxyl carrier protein
MTFDVEAGGSRRTIEVQRAGAGWAVIVDGRPMQASVSRSGARWSLLYGAAGETAADTTAPRSYEAVLERRHRGDQVVRVNGHAVRVSFVEHSRRSGSVGGSSSASGTKDVVAPMPGRIVKVLVKAGDRVVGGQGLVVVEAMKMENELRAPREGTVAAVRVSEGMSVDANAVLVVVE